MTRWKKWRGFHRHLILAKVKLRCVCGDLFTLEGARPDYPPTDRAHCLGCNRQFRLRVLVETRSEGDNDTR